MSGTRVLPGGTRVLPGGTLGILGGGQLGRMTALAARSLGYRVIVLDPNPDCSARGVVDEVIAAPFDDADAAAWLAAQSDAVTLEIEKIGPEAMAAVEQRAPLRPSRAVLHIIQDRARQRTWLAENGFPQGEWRAADGVEAIAAAARGIGRACRIKAARGGYDGRGQARLPTPADAARAHAEIGGAPAVVEAELDLQAELSVMVARNPTGQVAVFPVSRNWHVDSILDICHVPSGLPDAVVAPARDLAGRIATAIGLEGVLAVELFLVGGQLLVNELAPRPHNTFHTTTAACWTSQFEQLVRAACDLPLGDTKVKQPVALANLLGDLWASGDPPFPEMLAADPRIQLHLYDKTPRPKRKVGHLLATGDTPSDAAARVREARAVLEAATDNA